ncbi:MAG: glycosyltransferase [Candidatus Woesearchaeota archaeon]
MKISIVIPTLNEDLFIEKLIKSLLNQSLKPYEIIVVDGGSNDKTTEIIKKLSKKNKNVILIQTSKGVGYQRNVGGNKAKGDIIYFMDADTFPHKSFINNTLSEIKKRNLEFACPHYKPKPKTFLSILMFSFANFSFNLTQKFASNGAGHCIILKKYIFDKIKFKEKMVYEDIEFLRRVGKKHKYGFLKDVIYVSSRRYKKEGIKLFFKYFILSFFFAFGLFKLANKIEYKFSHYR